jgi:hypothetical protein
VNFLVRNFNEALRGKSYDGMAGYVLLCAYQDTQMPEYKKFGDIVTGKMMDMPLDKIRGNSGLMAAMGLAKAYELDYSRQVLKKLSAIFYDLARIQNRDGSFPHAYDGEDTHYTGWMVMEMILISPSLPSTLQSELRLMMDRAGKFLSYRIGPQGEPQYEAQVCDSNQNCHPEYYYAKKTSNTPEYDTRGWSNELGYEILSFHFLGYPAEEKAVRSFLETLPKDGAFPDKWAYPSDPASEPDQYPWSLDPQSVTRTSLLFWELAVLR